MKALTFADIRDYFINTILFIIYILRYLLLHFIQ